MECGGNPESFQGTPLWRHQDELNQQKRRRRCVLATQFKRCIQGALNFLITLDLRLF
jgi:hypothetical protein